MTDLEQRVKRLSPANRRIYAAFRELGLSEAAALTATAGQDAGTAGPNGFDRLTASFQGLGLSEDAAQLAAAGRDRTPVEARRTWQPEPPRRRTRTAPARQRVEEAARQAGARTAVEVDRFDAFVGQVEDLGNDLEHAIRETTRLMREAAERREAAQPRRRMSLREVRRPQGRP